MSETVRGYTSPRVLTQTNPSAYCKIEGTKETFVAYVNAVKDPLNIHLDIYWTEKYASKYEKALKYDYRFLSEESQDDALQTRTSYHCHLRGVEILADEDASANSKTAYIFLKENTLLQGNWILVSVGDIDIYGRILVNIFNILTKRSINKDMLNLTLPSQKKIAKEYVRSTSGKKLFNCDKSDYHFVVSTKKN